MKKGEGKETLRRAKENTGVRKKNGFLGGNHPSGKKKCPAKC